jgi:hypothetical protein
MRSINRIRKLLRHFYDSYRCVWELRQIHSELRVSNSIAAKHLFYSKIQNDPRYKNPAHLIHYERQVFSQNGEDGMLAEIFKRIGVKSKVFVECGVGDGLENNTAFLLFQGWRGYWIDGDANFANEIRQRFQKPLSDERLKLHQSFITVENIAEIFSTLKVPHEFDCLSLDIDRNTYHIWKALACFRPRVVVIEYNASFAPDVEWVVNYDPVRCWNGSMYFGASLKSLQILGEEMGYFLVGCDFAGANAFFIRGAEQKGLFAGPFTSEHHYEPPKYWMVRRDGHPRCFDDSNDAFVSLS